MSLVLHLGALVPAAIGLCCAAADRRRARMTGVAAAIAMLVAMADAALTHVVPVGAWALVLLAGGVAVAVVHRVRHGRAVTDASVMSTHTALGMVVMAGMLAVMAAPAGPSLPSLPQAGHAHGLAGGGLLAALGLGAALAYAAWSAVAARRPCVALDRAQYAAMGVATLAMGAAALV